jgi:integrase
MKKYNPNNERIKRQYLTFLKEAKRKSEPTVDAAAKALKRFEEYTKFSKTFTTYFFPVGEGVLKIVSEWVSYLRDEKLWGNEDPLFPATQIGLDGNRQFGVIGLSRKNWSNASPIRTIFKEAFTQAGLPYFNPHSFRNTLVKLGEEICVTTEQFKAWSQNLGHEKVLTTFLSYGKVACRRQGKIIRDLAKPQKAEKSDAEKIAEAVYNKFHSSGMKTNAPC